MVSFIEQLNHTPKFVVNTQVQFTQGNLVYNVDQLELLQLSHMSYADGPVLAPCPNEKWA